MCNFSLIEMIYRRKHGGAIIEHTFSTWTPWVEMKNHPLRAKAAPLLKSTLVLISGNVENMIIILLLLYFVDFRLSNYLQ